MSGAAAALNSGRDEAARDRRRRHVHRRGARRRRPRNLDQGADVPAAGGVSAGGDSGARCRGHRPFHPRHDSRDECAARAARRADGIHHHRRLRASAAPAAAGPRAPLSATGLASGAPRSASPLPRSTRADRARRRHFAARARVAAGARRGGDRRVPPLQLSRPEPRARGRTRSSGGATRQPMSSPRTSSRPSSASTSVPPPPRPTPTSAPRPRATYARSAKPPATRDCRSRS